MTMQPPTRLALLALTSAVALGALPGVAAAQDDERGVANLDAIAAERGICFGEEAVTSSLADDSHLNPPGSWLIRIKYDLR